MNNKILGLLFMTPYIAIVIGFFVYACTQMGWKRFLVMLLTIATVISVGLSFGYGITLLAK